MAARRAPRQLLVDPIGYPPVRPKSRRPGARTTMGRRSHSAARGSNWPCMAAGTASAQPIVIAAAKAIARCVLERLGRFMWPEWREHAALMASEPRGPVSGFSLSHPFLRTRVRVRQRSLLAGCCGADESQTSPSCSLSGPTFPLALLESPRSAVRAAASAPSRTPRSSTDRCLRSSRRGPCSSTSCL